MTKPFPSGETPWWHPDRHADRRPLLIGRAKIDAAVRLWMGERDFLVIDPPGLQRSPGNETHLHAFGTQMIGNDGLAQAMYLHTSPEFTMKKLLAAGEKRIASLQHVWRNRERSATHHPEFTMLEWYRVGEAYDVIIEDTVALIKLAAETTGIAEFAFKGRTCDPRLPAERVSVADAFLQFAGVDLLATMDEDGVPDGEKLAAQMKAVGMAIPDDNSWSYLFTHVLVEKVEPELGNGRVTVLDRYPACEAALARRVPGDLRVSERFEVYACGVELANGFGELTDPAEQRVRFEDEMNEKARIYGERYPIDEDFLAALAFMPEASGVALGFDRVVMLATGAQRIDAVLWAPVAE
ncbi:EF-P lysine aminoacylase EpmA [Devosia sp. MC1541]|uniref:EF-P lysine aminoacylase EpmA n=1 Tax=Devosia sp. MC1541 TaxID=2725264 RepID=UPI00145F4D3F|nr:EF-P lysine aminoacylase EpmA [Devosia sp. MC1541]